MSIISNIFSWFRPKADAEASDPTKQSRRAPQYTDKTEQLVVNKGLTYGLYHNIYPGLKLAGAMAFTPIAVPLWFMGLPIPTTGNDDIDLLLKGIVEQFPGVINQIHLQCHRDGTIWIFPKYSAEKKQLVWEFISDDTISDIVKDFETNEILQIVTDEQMTVTTGYGTTSNIRRVRSYTKDEISIRWLAGQGSVPRELVDETFRNPTGILPISFANNADGDEKRGHSDYSRIISDLKDYHDIDLKQSKVLSKFEPKLALTVNDVDTWLVNNGEEKGSLSTLDVFQRDILFMVDGETVEYIAPTNMYQAYESALKRKFRKILEGSVVPEILWGTKIEGNHASALEQMNNVVKFIEDKREQKNESYKKLFAASMQLLNISRGKNIENILIKIEWNNLDALSDETKSKIFKDFAQGAAYLVNAASASKEMLYKFYQKMFPGIAPDNFKDYNLGLDEMIKHKQYLSTDLATSFDLNGVSDLESDMDTEKEKAAEEDV